MKINETIQIFTNNLMMGESMIEFTKDVPNNNFPYVFNTILYTKII